MKTCSMYFFVCALLCSVVVYSHEIKDATLVGNIFREIQDLKSRQVTCDEKVSKLESVLTDLQQEVSSLRYSLNSMRENSAVQHNDHEGNQTYFNSSLRNRRQAISGQVAFTAGVSVGNFTHVGYTVIFDRAFSNIGSAYSTKSGIFHAPLKGTYVFTLTMMVVSRHSEYLEIVVDGNAINGIFADASSVDDYISTTKQWILDLSFGSRVWIRTNSFENLGKLHGAMHTLFSGFLLF